MFRRDLKDKTEYDDLTSLPLMTLFLKNAEVFFEKNYDKGADPVMIFFDVNGIRPFIARYQEGTKINILNYQDARSFWRVLFLSN